MLCDHMVHFSADLSLWLGSPVFGTDIKACPPILPIVVFQFHLEERWGMDVQTKCDISRTVEDRG